MRTDCKKLSRHSRDTTIIMIAHRLKTVRHTDQILVIDHGRIVQNGKHEQLINEPGIYADFVGGKKQTVGWKLLRGESTHVHDIFCFGLAFLTHPF